MSHKIHIRPDVALFPDGSIHVFVGGYFSILTVDAAQSLIDKLTDAVQRAKTPKESA